MENSSKDLLHLENIDSSSSLESTLLVCDKNKSLSLSKKPLPRRKSMTAPPLASEVLGKVKDFLGVISEANERLQRETKDKSREEYDIETLTGHEYIEMDLMLGVADLHTPEAVAAAESAMAGNQLAIDLTNTNSKIRFDERSTGTEASSSDDESDDEEDETCSPEEKKAPEDKGIGSPDTAEKHRSKKRTKIVELP